MSGWFAHAFVILQSLTGASTSQENVKGRTPIDVARTETTLNLLCPLHYAAKNNMLDHLGSLMAKVGRTVVLLQL